MYEDHVKDKRVIGLKATEMRGDNYLFYFEMLLKWVTCIFIEVESVEHGRLKNGQNWKHLWWKFQDVKNYITPPPPQTWYKHYPYRNFLWHWKKVLTLFAYIDRILGMEKTIKRFSVKCIKEDHFLDSWLNLWRKKSNIS